MWRNKNSCLFYSEEKCANVWRRDDRSSIMHLKSINQSINHSFYSFIYLFIYLTIKIFHFISFLPFKHHRRQIIHSFVLNNNSKNKKMQTNTAQVRITQSYEMIWWTQFTQLLSFFFSFSFSFELNWTEWNIDHIMIVIAYYILIMLVGVALLDLKMEWNENGALL